jgi:succinoglycan biosynthesis transport protein ExoP
MIEPNPLRQPLPTPPTPAAQRLTARFDRQISDRLATLNRYREILLAVFVLTSAAIMIRGFTSFQLFRDEGPLGPRTWLLSLAIGLAAAIAVAFVLDYMNDTIRTPEDVQRKLQRPILGLVPAVHDGQLPVLASAEVANDFGESFRALRTALLSAYPNPGTQVLVVTSAQPFEGKTIVAANLAMALAYGGARVLLIDAHLARPGLHRALRLANERGLAQVLGGQARVRDVIQHTQDPNLLAITAGRMPPNPSEMVSSERMKTLLANLGHGAFDWIVIETPPVLTVNHVVVLAPSAAGIICVVGAGMTRWRLAQRAVAAILSATPPSLFVVLNRVDFSTLSKRDSFQPGM